jgi:hypothetical protein
LGNPKTKQEIKYEGLIDSGADVCMFEADVGEQIGLEIEKGERQTVRGIVKGQGREYYMHDIEIDIGGWPRAIRAGFMRDISREGHGFLGQRGFFDQVKSVKFEKLKGLFEVTPL